MGTGARRHRREGLREKVGEAKYGSGMNVMGSGPYKLASWKSGSEIVLEANPDYWDPNLQPKVQKVTLKFITDTSTITSALLSGEIDGAYEVPPTSIPALKSALDRQALLRPQPLGLRDRHLEHRGPDGQSPAAQGPRRWPSTGRPSSRRCSTGRPSLNKTLTPPTAWDPEAHQTSTSRRTTRCPATSPTSRAPSRSSPARRAPTSRWSWPCSPGDQRELRVWPASCSRRRRTSA